MRGLCEHRFNPLESFDSYYLAIMVMGYTCSLTPALEHVYNYDNSIVTRYDNDIVNSLFSSDSSGGRSASSSGHHTLWRYIEACRDLHVLPFPLIAEKTGNIGRCLPSVPWPDPRPFLTT